MTSEELRSRANKLLTDLRIIYFDQIKPGNQQDFKDLQNRYGRLDEMQDTQGKEKLVSDIKAFYKLNNIDIPYNGGRRRRSSTSRKSTSSRRRRSTKRRTASRKQQKRRRGSRRAH
jgi:hypothetical protein